jgi:cold shock CspA family protein
MTLAHRLHDGEYAMETGTVQRLLQDKGFGFIRANGRELFFHRSTCPEFDQLREGDTVEFEEVSSQKGPRAERVVRP